MAVLVFCHVTVQGQVTRHVTCERCHHAFDYVVVRKQVLDTLPFSRLVRSAEWICRERLARQLASAVDPVACPACGWMQTEMIPELRRRFARPLRAFGLFLVIASAGMAMLFLALGLWFKAYPIDADVDWLGIAAASVGGVAAGLLIMSSCALLGLLRYPPGRRAAASAPSPA